MKKITIALVLVFAFALTMNAAFARYNREDSCCGDRHNHSDECCPSVDVDNENHADVDNNVVTVANSGLNGTGGNDLVSLQRSRWYHHETQSGLVETDTADALATVDTSANHTEIYADDPYRGSVDIDNNNRAYVDNCVITVANSGLNRASRGTVRAGEAISTASVTTVVNSTVIEVED